MGIDVGGVIRDKAHPLIGGDVDLQAIPNLGAIEAVRRFVARLGASNVYIVSKASEHVASRTLEWFVNIDFFTSTGLLKENVHFCKERADKAAICKGLGVTHFIDDHTDVLKRLDSVPHLILFNPSPAEMLEKGRACDRIKAVPSWGGVLKLLDPRPKDFNKLICQNYQGQKAHKDKQEWNHSPLRSNEENNSSAT